MAQRIDSEEEDVEKLLDKLADIPARDPQAQADGRARFLAQAKAVSQAEKRRHTGWNKNFFERILKPMKLKTKLSALATLIVVAVVAVLVVSNVTTVSAQQILSRATAAAAMPSQGIWHTRIQIYENHQLLAGDHPGTTTLDDSYEDLTTGLYRFVTRDSAGNLLQAGSSDGTYSYSGVRQTADSNPLTVIRAKADPRKVKQAGTVDVTAITKSLFDDFKNNPRVRVDPTRTWTDGNPVYVLIDDNYQSQKGSSAQTLTGSVRMVFDAKTYRLVESQTTTRKDGQDIVIDEDQWLVNEILPEGSPVAWDLSDLKGIKIVDQPDQSSNAQASPTIENLTRSSLAAHTKDFFVLNPVPDGYTEKILAVADQPKDQDYAFEIHYIDPNGKDVFNMQAVGKNGPGFVQSNFYDGSYKAASGLELHYSPSSSSGVSAMLVAPDGEDFLLFSSLTRPQVQQWVETLVQGQ